MQAHHQPRPLRKIVRSILLATTLSATLTACATKTPEPVKIYEHDRFRFSAQPSKADLQTAADSGIKTVISLRSKREMDQLDFDQAAHIDKLGMAYIHIPLGGDHGYSPEQLSLFTQALKDADWPVYLHCASGGRARQIWMAHEINTGNLTVDQAKQIERTIGAREPTLDQLLDTRITYDLAPNPKD